MEAFLAMPPTPDARLQRDIWNRLNALNQKKLEGLEWKVKINKKENAKAQRIRRRLRRQAEREGNRVGVENESEHRGQNEDGRSNSYAPSEDDEHRSFRRWSQKLAQLLRKCRGFYRENIVPGIMPALIFVSWFVWIMTHVKNVVLRLPGTKGWSYKLGFLFP
jgi:hypothetical protein